MPELLRTLLENIQPSAAIVVGVTASAPWGVEFVDSGGFAYHVIVEGEALLTERRKRGLSADFSLPTDALAIVAPNVPHALRSGRTAQSQPLQVIEQKTVNTGQGWKLYEGGDGSVCRMVCGTFTIDPALAPILTPAFPAVSVFDQTLLNPRFTQLIELIVGELEEDCPGASAIIQRYAEVLFLEILRGFAAQNLSSLGIFAAMRDPNLARSLAAFHASPANPWTIQALAAQAGMSPSTFKRTFNAHLPVPPHEYVLRWRLSEAARRLRETEQPVTRISEAIGFASNTSFNKAFQRIYHCTPGTYRTLIKAPSA